MLVLKNDEVCHFSIYITFPGANPNPNPNPNPNLLLALPYLHERRRGDRCFIVYRQTMYL